MIEIICFFYLLLNARKIRCAESRIIFFMLDVVLLGIVGTLINGYQNSYIAIFKDVLLVLKFPIITVALIVKDKKDGFNVNSKHMISIINFYVIILLAFGIISLFHDIGMSQSYEIRYGIVPFQFLYSYPTFLAYSLIFMSIVLLGNIDDYSKHKLTQFAILFLLILTMRDKAFAYVALYILLIFIVPNKKKIRPVHFVIAGIAAFLISYDKIVAYSHFSWSPRYALYSTMIDVAKDNFPFGSGLASFGSDISGRYYSNIYYVYGMAEKLGPNNYVELNDAQWPYYFGQFGVLGGLIFLYVLWLLYKECRKLISNRVSVKPLYLMYGYIMIASLVETFFC